MNTHGLAGYFVALLGSVELLRAYKACFDQAFEQTFKGSGIGK
jgi:hypothetical protein